MRLIDADVLRLQFDAGQNVYEPGDTEPSRVNCMYAGDEVRAIIDAAPTIECEACEHLDSESDDTWVCSCPDSPTDGMEIPDPSVEACRYFERRQP